MRRVDEAQRIAKRSHHAMSPAASKGAAVIFVRHRATMGIGHVGWGFLVHAGETGRSLLSLLRNEKIWGVGAVENHYGTFITPPLKDGYWCKQTAHPLKEVACRGYDHYKVVSVEGSYIEKALKEEALVRERPYIAAVSNCMNDVFNILTAYGVHGLPDPSYLFNWMPNAWYSRIDAAEFPIDDETGLDEVHSG